MKTLVFNRFREGHWIRTQKQSKKLLNNVNL